MNRLALIAACLLLFCLARLLAGGRAAHDFSRPPRRARGCGRDSAKLSGVVGKRPRARASSGQRPARRGPHRHLRHGIPADAANRGASRGFVRAKAWSRPGASYRDVARAAGASRVLVIGHSNTLPEIIKALGISSPIAIGESDYSDLFLVVLDEPPRLLHLHYH